MTILEEIKQKGFYWSSPSVWSDAQYQELKGLLDEGVIESIRDAGILCTNADYCFILKGNPSGVHVMERNERGWSVQRVVNGDGR